VFERRATETERIEIVVKRSSTKGLIDNLRNRENRSYISSNDVALDRTASQWLTRLFDTQSPQESKKAYVLPDVSSL